MRRIPSILTAAAVVTAASMAHGQQFNRDVAALSAPNIWTDGVELSDVDLDGDLDLLFANGSSYGGTGGAGSQPQHLYLNDGAGNFTAAHGQLNVANFNAKLVVAEDFDGDGDPDLIYASGSTGSPPRLLINDGTGNFSDQTGTRIPAFSPNPRSFSVGAGDVDNDGDMDIAVSNGGTFGGIASQAILLKNDGSGFFTNVTASQMPSDNYNCQDIQFIDFDGDFDLDMVLSGKGGSGKRARLYLNDGNGNFSIDSAMDGVGTGNTYEIDYADLDGDNDFDASVQSISGSSEGWARNDGPGVAMPEFTFPTPNGNDDNEMANMDYDNDGDLDVFVASLASTEKLYRNNGNGTFTAQNAEIQSIGDSTLDMEIGDIDGDCDYDLITGQGESGNWTNKVYDNNGPGSTPDTIAPRFLNVEDPSGTAGSDIVFRAHIQDAVSEDSQTNATATYAYTTSDGGAGSGAATHQGGGMFRAAVPTTGATTSVSLTWTASDGCGNTDTAGASGTIAGSPWMDLGCALAGVSGDPSLVGTGPLTGGSSNALTLTNAAPSAIAALFVSLAENPTSFKGGTIKTVPVLTSISLVTSGAGTIPLPFTFPVGIPSGFEFFVQYGIDDAAAVKNVALSNAVKGTSN